MAAVLVLNASMEPLGVVSPDRAVVLCLRGKARVVAVDPSGAVYRSSSGRRIAVPTVVALVSYVRVPYRRVPLNRRMLNARDASTCQVSGCTRRGSTVDHVVPRSRGGSHSWENVVLMCERHNAAKADRLLSELDWTLKRTPSAPTLAIVRTDESWEPWLPWAAPAAATV